MPLAGRYARSVASGQAPRVARAVAGRRCERRGRVPSTIATWAGNRGSRPEAVLRPASEEQVADILAEAAANGRRVKPIGASHSWSGAQLTDGVALRLDQMQGVLAVDAEVGTIRVGAGTRLKELMRLLGERGLSLPVRGSIAEQSIAGATATGTHGSAPGQGCLSARVTALRLVTPGGMVRAVSSDDTDPQSRDLFDAARVGLGALGVITEMTLRVVPDFVLREEVEPVEASDAVRDLEAIRTSAPFVKLWLVPHTGKALVFRYWPTDEAPTLSAVAGWVDEKIVNKYLLRGLLAATRSFDIAAPPAMRLVGAAYLSGRTRIGPARDILGLPVPPAHGEIEYGLPLADGAEAFARLEHLVRNGGHPIAFIQELRFSAADDIWLSPAYQRDTCWLGAYSQDIRSEDPYTQAAEAMLHEYGGRPHWGKTFTADRDYLAAVLPRFADFNALRRRLDPAGVLGNDFTDRVLGDN
jgi:FAD-linked oxidoreductase